MANGTTPSYVVDSTVTACPTIILVTTVAWSVKTGVIPAPFDSLPASFTKNNLTPEILAR